MRNLHRQMEGIFAFEETTFLGQVGDQLDRLFARRFRRIRDRILAKPMVKETVKEESLIGSISV